jgi:hypothetical protein
MTDRLNDAPGDDLVPTADEIAEETPDLTDAEIAAASDAAADEVGEAEAGGETLEEAEAYDAEELLEGEAADETEDEADEERAPAPPGRRLTAAEAAARRSAGPGRMRDARGPKPTRTAFAIDPALRIRDQASAAFVVASILVFLLIFLNAMAFGHGGAFTPIPTATPFVSASPAPSASPGASGSAAPSGAATPAPSAAPSAPPATTAPSPAGT